MNVSDVDKSGKWSQGPEGLGPPRNIGYTRIRFLDTTGYYGYNFEIMRIFQQQSRLDIPPVRITAA